MSEHTFGDGKTLAELERTLDQLLASGPSEPLPDEILQKMFTVAVQRYSSRYEENRQLAPLLGQYVNATDVSTSCLEMLRVVDLEIFELTFWGNRLAALRD